MEYVLHVVIPKKLSLNQYHTLHYFTLNGIKQQFYEAVKFSERSGYMPPPPYHVHYHFQLWGFQMDVSNLVGMVKPLEDGMVRMGLFSDDSYDIIKSITITEDRAPESSKKNKRSYCTITIQQANISPVDNSV